ncbi:hypothetical protein B0H11DRAFT_2070732, partial [Mycena galericulata]
MPNPVDDSPLEPGEITLPLLASDPQHNQGVHRLRTFRHRVLYVFTVFLTLGLVALWEHPPNIRRPIEELALQPLDIATDPRLEPYQSPENAEYCTDWALGVGTADEGFASFELPTTADLLFFLSRGPVYGEINVIKGSSSSGPIEVNVAAQYHDFRDLERTKVCRMGPADEHGLLVWAEPRHPHGDPRRDVRFNITVAFPTGARDYNDFTTDLAQFSHSFDSVFDVWSATSLKDIRLKTSNAPVFYASLVGIGAVFIQTSNAKVQGFFAGFDLHVQTSNAPIEATALMLGEGPGSESRVHLKTSNGAIKTNLGLMSDHDDSTLRAIVQTSGGALTIGTPRYGMTPGFFLDASTTVGPATIYLYPEYEGTYDLQTSLAGASVEGTVDIPDPSGKKKLRTVTKTREGQHAQGSVYWSDSGEPCEGVQWGSVNISTTISPVKMYIS